MPASLTSSERQSELHRRRLEHGKATLKVGAFIVNGGTPTPMLMKIDGVLMTFAPPGGPSEAERRAQADREWFAKVNRWTL
jgi:hypothetical protein